ncbi:MAG: 1,5-anhydro-D-fructose reductase [Planctomycetota bacterium]|jgi:myo-inositol 2-dehydrogenase/D-chiro-inositol 1-dehydrogenase
MLLMVEIRFGLIGFGAWGTHHARAIRETPGAILAAVAGRSPASVAAAREACPDATVVADYRELLERHDLDVIDIVVPTHQHAEIASAALASGRHVLLEKPMAGSLDECRQILAAAKASRRLLAIGFELRLSRLWGRVEQLLREDAIGTPLYCLIELFRRPYRTGSGGWRYDRDRVGNWILEEPIHFFDLARWYLSSHGEPTTVTARSNSIDNDRPLLCDNFSAFLDFPNGAYAVITQTLAAFEHHQTVKLTGTRGAIWASWGGAMDRTFTPTFSLRHFDGRNVHSIDCDGPAGEVFELQQQIARMCDAVRGSQPLHADGHDGLRAVELCLAAEESAQLRQTVSL